MSKSRSSPRIAVTPGEPAGIGPELCIQAHGTLHTRASLTYFADPAMLLERARMIGADIDINDLSLYPASDGAMNVHPVSLAAPSVPGNPDTGNAVYVINCLAGALANCRSGKADAMVTGPVNKAIINEAGIPFSGHTEWLAEQTGTGKVVMMLAGGSLRVALVTTHLPLKDVSAAITADNLSKTMSILHDDLVHKFAIPNPRIMVCGLNPHAGEGGHLGREEIETIGPVIRQFQARGWQIEGPIPADTVFTRPWLDQTDAVLAMYHDQGLPVLKHAAFGNAVNITLGLPIIRTSVDHGTAFDLAGTGRADIGSLVSAIDQAIDLASRVNE